MEDAKAVKLMLQALFNIQGKVSDIHALLLAEEDDDGEAETEEDT